MNNHLLEEFKKVCNAQIPKELFFKSQLDNDLRNLIEYLGCRYSKTNIRQKVLAKIKTIGYSTDLGFNKWFPNRIDFYKNKWGEMTKYTANNRLYKSLVEIGLQDYLKQRGGANIHREDHMLKLNLFIKNLPDDQKKILKEKINKKINTEIETKFNEIIKELNEPKICVRYVHFGSLREKIANQN